MKNICSVLFQGGLPRSLRSLAMTLLFYVILNDSEESHRITDRAYTLLTLVVGYFACAQYDVLFLLSLRGSEATKQTPGRVVFRKAYTFSLWSWDISLTLNMTCFFYCLCEEAKRRSKLPGGWRSTGYVFRTLSVGYFACAQYDVLFNPYRRQRRR